MEQSNRRGNGGSDPRDTLISRDMKIGDTPNQCDRSSTLPRKFAIVRGALREGPDPRRNARLRSVTSSARHGRFSIRIYEP